MLKATEMIGVEIYSDEEIRAWDKEDCLEAVERDAILKNLRSALAPSVSPIQTVSEFLDSFTKPKSKKRIRRRK